MQEQMSNISTEMKDLGKNTQEKLLEIRNNCNKIKNVLDGLISRLDLVQEKICEVKDRSVILPKWKCIKK